MLQILHFVLPEDYILNGFAGRNKTDIPVCDPEGSGEFFSVFQNQPHHGINAHNLRTYKWRQSDPFPGFSVLCGMHRFGSDRFRAGRLQCRPPIPPSVFRKIHGTVYLRAFLIRKSL